jgi:hypothetical protein
LVNFNGKSPRQVTFVRSGVGPNKAIEFHAVKKNKGGVPLVSDVRTRLGKEHAGAAGAVAELRPDETRTYSGSIPAERDAESRYFMIEVR